MSIRNVAISGVDTVRKYIKCCKIVTNVDEITMSQKEIDIYFRNGDNILFDDGIGDTWFHYWDKGRNNFENCTLYTYEEFIKKFGESGDADLETIKPLYIVDGKLSATKEVPHTEIDKLKEKYATGKYDCYFHDNENSEWSMYADRDIKKLGFGNELYKLILKVDTFIANAVIANPHVQIEYATPVGWSDLRVNFFETYLEETIYRLKKQPKQVSEDYFTVTETTLSSEVESDGSSNSFYVFPDYVCDVDSLCRYWNLSSAEGNILKSLTANLGSRHGGTDKKREVRKSLHYAIERMRWNEFSDEDIIAQVEKHFKS